jgi:hypothetical protein
MKTCQVPVFGTGTINNLWNEDKYQHEEKYQDVEQEQPSQEDEIG